MYVKCDDVQSARLVFDRMPRRDRISWNAMISGYFENGECLEGLRLFFSMRELSVNPDLMTMTNKCFAFLFQLYMILRKKASWRILAT